LDIGPDCRGHPPPNKHYPPQQALPPQQAHRNAHAQTSTRADVSEALAERNERSRDHGADWNKFEGWPAKVFWVCGEKVSNQELATETGTA